MLTYKEKGASVMFWGLMLEPGKRYGKTVDHAFHISSAVLDTSCSDDSSIIRVMVEVDGADTILCNLSLEHGILQAPLDLQFMEGDKISFFTNGGKVAVHLSGYLIPTDDMMEEIGEEEDSDDEVPDLISASTVKRKNNAANISSPKKPKFDELKLNTSLKKEQTKLVSVDNFKKVPELINLVPQRKENMQLKVDSDADNDSDDDSEDDDSDDGESDDDDDDDNEEEDDDNSDGEEDEEEEAEDDDTLKVTPLTKKGNAASPIVKQMVAKLNESPKHENSPKTDKSPISENMPQPPKTPKAEEILNSVPKPATGKKSKKEKLKEQSVQNVISKTPDVQNLKMTNSSGLQNNKSINGESQKNAKTPELKKHQAKNIDLSTPAKSPKMVKTAGVIVEDIVPGTGQEAMLGRMVSVYYEGRLKKNNKMFDKTLIGPPFKFRLGFKEVIQGWDIGVVGMKVGGKRRVICPPHTAYGKKGAPPDIPPDATLVFLIELKGVY